MPPPWDQVFAALTEELARGGNDAWLVGGCLRDAQLGAPVYDVDLATTAEPLELAKLLRSRFGASVASLPRSARVTMSLPDDASSVAQLDIATLKSSTVEGDLRQRDFTINAMALPIHAWRAVLDSTNEGMVTEAPPELLDPTGGQDDLAHRRLRVAGHEAFLHDPGRVIRGARLIARYGLTPTDETIALAQDARARLRSLSDDRLRDELNLLLAAPGCADGLQFLNGAGVLATLLPELSVPRAVAHALAALHATSALQRSRAINAEAAPAFSPDTPLGQRYATHLPDGAPRIVALRWGLLLHAATPHDSEKEVDVGRDLGQAIQGFRRFLRGPERRIIYEVEARASFTARALGYREPDERDLRRLFAGAGDVTVDVLVGAAACALGFAEQGISFDGEARIIVERVHRILDLYFADPARLIPPPLLTGRDLIRELGVEPGTEIHRLLVCVREAQLDGQVATREEALALAREMVGE